jgi:hypothetical protein
MKNILNRPSSSVTPACRESLRKKDSGQAGMTHYKPGWDIDLRVISYVLVEILNFVNHAPFSTSKNP